MFAKMLAVILSCGAIAASLLICRQERIDTHSEITRTHHRIIQHERALWDLRSEIAGQCRPERIREMMEQLPDEWRSMPDLGELPPTPDAMESGAVHTVAMERQSSRG
jgi:hypothetical protein